MKSGRYQKGFGLVEVLVVLLLVSVSFIPFFKMGLLKKDSYVQEKIMNICGESQRGCVYYSPYQQTLPLIKIHK